MAFIHTSNNTNVVFFFRTTHIEYDRLVDCAHLTTHVYSIPPLCTYTGDVLSGVCSVAVWSDDTAARDMVLIPSTVYLFVGLVFWTAGFVSLFRIRSVMRRDGLRGADGLEKCIARIGIFNVLYVVPATVQILCLVYEHVNVGSWIVGWRSAVCRNSDHALECPSPEIDGPGTDPSLEVFIAKYVVSLQVGIASSIWMCSGKTLNNWQRLLALVPRNPDESETYVWFRFDSGSSMSE